MSVHEQNGFNFGIPYFINFKGHSIHQSINLMKNCKPRNKRKAIEVAEGAYLLTTIVSDIFALRVELVSAFLILFVSSKQTLRGCHMDSLNGMVPRTLMVTAEDGLLCKCSGTRQCE